MTFRRTTCPHCRGKLAPGQRIHPGCIDGYAEAQEAKAKRAEAKRVRAAAKVERVETRRRKEESKRTGELKAEAQDACNAYIRYRDRNENCIDCDQPFEPNKPGGSMDAGHFFSRSQAPHLRFNEDNVFAQRKNCNRPGGTTFAQFRAGVVRRIGEERTAAVVALANITPPPMKKDDYRDIRDTYRRKLRELKAGRAE